MDGEPGSPRWAGDPPSGGAAGVPPHPGAPPQGDRYQAYQGWHLDQGPDHAANAAPDAIPKTPMATAIASSKLLPEAVKARVAARG